MGLELCLFLSQQVVVWILKRKGESAESTLIQIVRLALSPLQFNVEVIFCFCLFFKFILKLLDLSLVSLLRFLGIHSV